MPKLTATVFGAMRKKADPELLAAPSAAFARNMRLSSGSLEPWKAPAAVPGVATWNGAAAQTLYRFGRDSVSRTNFWFRFDGDVNIVKGPVPTDTEERTYWTDGAYPKKTRASLAGLLGGQAIVPTSLRMGVPPPGWNGRTGVRTYTPTLAVSGVAADPASTPRTSTYIVTYVSSWGEESAPSNASAVVTWRAGQTVTVTLPGALAGAYSVDRVRIYRSATGNTRTAFQLVAEVALAASYADTKADDQLGEGCATWDWYPPEDAMIGLTDIGNGTLAGFNKNTVCFCEPNFPYAWPPGYEHDVSHPVVGISHFDQTVVVGTTGGLVLLSSSDPQNVSEERPAGGQACLSKRSMVRVEDGVVYAGADGLALVGRGGIRNLTEDIMSKEQWMAYKPETMAGYYLDGRYICTFDNGTKGALIFSLGDDPGFVELDQWWSAGFVEPLLDTLFVIHQAGATNSVREWDTGAALTAAWKSPSTRFQGGLSMAYAKVIASAYPVTFTVFHDGTPWQKVVPNNLPFTLPPKEAEVYAFQVDAASTVREIRMATSVRELGDSDV